MVERVPSAGGADGRPPGDSAAERAHSLFRYAQDGIAYADLDGRLLEVNDAFARLTGHDPASLLCMTYQALTPGEYHDMELRMVRSVLESGQATGYEKEYLRKDGRRVPVWICVFAVRSEDGRAQGLGAIVRDLSERRATDQALRHIQRIESLRVLARGVSHDFNNVLGTVLGHLTLAQQVMPEGSAAHEHIGRAGGAIHRAAALVDQLLLYAGSGEYRPETIDLNAWLDELRPILEAALGEHGRLHIEAAEDVPPLPVDRLQLQQLIMQILANCAEARRGDMVTVTIRTRVHVVTTHKRARWSRTGTVLREGRYAAIEIEDDGCGMDAETLQRVFDPFYSTKFIGRGLGLATALGIVRAHHGSIDIESEPRRGSKVTILLPFETTAAPVRPLPPAASAVRSGMILLVEDEPDILNFAAHILRGGGFEVLTAADGMTGIEMFQAHRAEIRLVLLDLSMPRMGGEETLRRLREIDTTSRVLLTSGYSHADATAGFAPEDLAGFLHKPYDGETLLAKVRECLA
jgi:two-component system, cell cycle sensor histidine kinase and response regulator CckA